MAVAPARFVRCFQRHKCGQLLSLFPPLSAVSVCLSLPHPLCQLAEVRFRTGKSIFSARRRKCDLFLHVCKVINSALSWIGKCLRGRVCFGQPWSHSGWKNNGGLFTCPALHILGKWEKGVFRKCGEGQARSRWCVAQVKENAQKLL